LLLARRSAPEWDCRGHVWACSGAAEGRASATYGAVSSGAAGRRRAGRLVSVLPGLRHWDSEFANAKSTEVMATAHVGSVAPEETNL
jgi:hypothetical protein